MEKHINNQENNKPLTKKQRRELRKQEKIIQKQKEQRKKTIKLIIKWVLILLSIFLVVIFIYTSYNSNNSQAVLKDSISKTDRVFGNPKAKTILIEYSDFQCPACARFYPIVKQLKNNLGDKFRFVYRHFPLKQIHKNAENAAKAAEAAGMQGKFWEMHNILFENQNEWDKLKDPLNTFLNYAKSLKIDINKFKSDFNSKEVSSKIKNDYRSGIRAGVSGTPTFFLNGKQIRPTNYEEFKALILQAQKQIKN